MILNGKVVQDDIIEQTKVDTSNKDIVNAIIVLGKDPASETYVKNKVAVCEAANIGTIVFQLDMDTTESELLDLIDRLNSDNEINGILIQLPLPSHIDEKKVAKAVHPNKDLDCFNPVNIGNMTPVPNGIGRTTVAVLIHNSLACYNKQKSFSIQ